MMGRVRDIQLRVRDIQVFLLGFILFFSSCEKDITIDLPDSADKIVVEGHIEPGQPTYVILTKNISFFTTTGISDLNNIFVKGAVVKVSDGTQTVLLDEFCLNDLPPGLKEQVLEFLGISESQAQNTNICAYVSLSLMGEVGKSYTLTVETAEHSLSAVTSIPSPVLLDSLWTIPDPEFADSLVALWMQIKEPDTLGNYYRYFTKANDEPFYPGYFGSVFDDQFANGSILRLFVDKGYSRSEDIDFDTYGLFRKGDTIIMKLASIDRPHFRFWSTIEDQILSGGPFSTPTYIQSNVKGGLGIWGGYGSDQDTIIVPK